MTEGNQTPRAGLRGRAVVVSGGTSGLGFAVAQRLVAEGARVWILGSSQKSVGAALRQLDGAAGGSAGDAAEEAAVEAGVAAAVEQLGGIDGAFCNAGIDGENRNALELSADHFRRVLDVNVVGAFLLARSVARVMAPGSAIVINASLAALRPRAGFADYNTSKAAAATLAKSLALDLSERGIAVMAVCPGTFPTPMTAERIADPATRAQILSSTPAGRLGEPEELAALVGFLLSGEAPYMTGSIVTIGGGG
ncbi:MAG TPA: SDR family oxidoreductase [Solirubrobacterales bacterium]|nr:SDR family oxidoreductase [Solirubrobacterales bacterium]